MLARNLKSVRGMQKNENLWFSGDTYKFEFDRGSIQKPIKPWKEIKLGKWVIYVLKNV